MRRIGGLLVLACVVAAVAAAQGRDPLLEMMRMQVELEKRVMALDIGNYERVQEQLRDATDRLLRLGDDLLRAEKEGEDAGSLSARSQDVRGAEADVAELMTIAQQIRSSLATRRAYLDQLNAEVRRLEEALQAGNDELSGRWQVSIEPGGSRGVFDLKLDGTLVSGTYQLSGGWKGSLRGTYIGGTLRIERIDGQLGFVAVYTARLATRDTEKRLEGSWEATNLAAGMPVSGAWVGRRETGR